MTDRTTVTHLPVSFGHKAKSLCASLAALAVLVAGPAVQAEPAQGSGQIAQQGGAAAATIDAEVSVIHATNDPDGGIDPAIGKLPNLGNYKSYRLLQRSKVSMKKGAPTTTTLPNARTLQITLKDVKEPQYVIDTSINAPGGTAFLPLLEVRATVGAPVFIAGQSYQSGMLIIGIKILPR
jgi:hypothetical protein